MNEMEVGLNNFDIIESDFQCVYTMSLCACVGGYARVVGVGV